MKCPAMVFTKACQPGRVALRVYRSPIRRPGRAALRPGSALCLLETHGDEPRVRTLLDEPHGMIRDPDVSLRRPPRALRLEEIGPPRRLPPVRNGTRLAGPSAQLTFGLGFADYEGAYLPGGDIIFNSTRCVQTVDCLTTEVSNLYTCDRDGRHLRRLGFDQVHTNFPTVTSDGRVLYTRWEYNDRGQIFPQALFQMNPDGTGQIGVLRQQFLVPHHDPAREEHSRHAEGAGHRQRAITPGKWAS